MKKLFGGINLTWTKVIIVAIIAGAYTAVMALIPALKYTSFHTICVTFEVWILFGIIIIMNSKSNMDSALKCFVFFLISQPLVYLIQVPFSPYGWKLFGFYKYWFMWTLCCFPMGYIGYYIKKDKWWGYLILFPILVLLTEDYCRYFSDMVFGFPRYLLITLFCAVTLIIYPLYLFNNKKIRMVGLSISIILVILGVVLVILDPPVYETIILASSEEQYFDDTYKAYLKDPKYGTAEIIYDEGLEDYAIYVKLKKEGTTTLVVESPNEEKLEYKMNIKKDTYNLKRITE